MKAKISFMVGVLAVLAFVVTLMPGPVQAESIELTYANFPPAPTFPCVQMERWKNAPTERSPSRPFPAGPCSGPKT